AALAVGIGRGSPLPDVLRLAVAAGALNVTRRGLGSGRREDVELLAESVALRELPDSERSAGGSAQRAVG
ncbi:MAG TPA: hypothetical protein VFQ12_02965, partial [Thermoleophilaceae bacterium]|nr:hypothetical protein [Thermoleophilaceae bacterium]